MLKEAHLPMEFWDKAVEADAYMRNRTATGPVIDGMTVSPEEAWTGETPSIDHIRVWGSKCYSYINPKTIPAQQRHDKLVDPARVGVFMGYSTTTDKHLKVYSPELGYTTRSSKVTIDESVQGGVIDLRIRNCEAGPQGTYNIQPDRKPRGRPSNQPTEKSPSAIKPTIDDSAIPKTVPKVIIPHFIPPPNVPAFNELNDDVVVPIQQDSIDTTRRHYDPTVEDAIDEPEAGEILENASLQEVSPKHVLPTAVSPTDNIPPREKQELLRYFTRAEKRKRTDSSAAETEQYSKVVKAMLAQMELSTKDLEILERAFPATEINGVKIPQTYQQAINDPTYGKQWKLAITEEIISLIENGTWKQVVPPAGANLVSTKWVFTIKTKADGTIERFKARLVARGFSQIHSQDYSDTFAPTVHIDTL